MYECGLSGKPKAADAGTESWDGTENKATGKSVQADSGRHQPGNPKEAASSPYTTATAAELGFDL